MPINLIFFLKKRQILIVEIWFDKICLKKNPLWSRSRSRGKRPGSGSGSRRAKNPGSDRLRLRLRLHNTGFLGVLCLYIFVRFFLSFFLDFCFLTLTEHLQACFYCMTGRRAFFLNGQNLASLSADLFYNDIILCI